MTKYVIEDMNDYGRYVIRALIDIPKIGVKAGDLGGEVLGYHNLSQDGACWVFPGSYVIDSAYIKGNAVLYSGSIVSGYAEMWDNTSVRGQCLIKGHAQIKDNASLMGTIIVSDYVTIHKDAYIAGVYIFDGSKTISTTMPPNFT